MSDIFWYKLYSELNLGINSFDDEGTIFIETIEEPIPSNHYPRFIMEIASRFIGECSNKLEKKGIVPQELKDLRWKLTQYFKSNFGVDYSKEIEFPLTYKNEIAVPRSYMGTDLYLIVLSSRIEAFILAFGLFK